MKTATRIPALDKTDHDELFHRGIVQRTYRLSEPLDGHNIVVVSATNVPYSGPETYIFPGDDTGKITGWGELEGSYKGGLDHTKALENAGYTVVDG